MTSNRKLSTVLLVLVFCIGLIEGALYLGFVHANDCPSYCARADVNQDGFVNTADSFMVSKCIAAQCTVNDWTARMDVNQDGVIDHQDVEAIVTCIKMGCCKPE